MSYQIRPHRPDEPIPYELLLLADPNPALIDAYLSDGQLYVVELPPDVAETIPNATVSAPAYAAPLRGGGPAPALADSVGVSNVVGAAVLVVGSVAAEIVNVAVAPAFQRRGLGRALLQALTDAARRQGVAQLLIATSNASIGQLALYQQEGFDLIDIDRDYFLRNYAEPIWENGIWCRHQLIFRKTLLPD